MAIRGTSFDQADIDHFLRKCKGKGATRLDCGSRGDWGTYTEKLEISLKQIKDFSDALYRAHAPSFREELKTFVGDGYRPLSILIKESQLTYDAINRRFETVYRSRTEYNPTQAVMRAGIGGMSSSSQNALLARLSASNETSQTMERESVRDFVNSMQGTRIIQATARDLGEMSMEATAIQVKMHNSLITAMLPLFYKEDWAQSSDAISTYWRLREQTIHTKVALTAPRRTGKTMCVSMISAAFLNNCEGLEQMIVATTGEVAKMYITTTLLLLGEILGPDARVDAKAGQITAWPWGRRGPCNKLTAFSSEGKTGRGVTAQFVIVDEAAFVNERYLRNVVYPLGLVTGTALVCMSSPAESGDSCFSAMFEAQIDGVPIFSKHSLELKCAPCEELGIEDCRHRRRVAAPWHDPKSKAELKALYEASNDLQAYEREVEGKHVASNLPAFSKDHIERLEHKKSYPRNADRPFRRVFVSIDPSGGGTGSDTALVAHAIDEEDHFVIVAAVSFSIRDASMEFTLQKTKEILHWLSYENPTTRRSQIVLIIEANYNPTYPTVFKNMIDDRMASGALPRTIYFMHECKSAPDRPGVFKPRDYGVGYHRVLNSLLKEDRVSRLCNGWFACDPADERKDSLESYHELTGQLKRYNRTLIKPATVSNDAVYRFSGKSAGKDDLAIALQQSFYWSVIFHASNTRYGKIRGPAEPPRLIRNMQHVHEVSNLVYERHAYGEIEGYLKSKGIDSNTQMHLRAEETIAAEINAKRAYVLGKGKRGRASSTIGSSSSGDRSKRSKLF